MTSLRKAEIASRSHRLGSIQNSPCRKNRGSGRSLEWCHRRRPAVETCPGRSQDSEFFPTIQGRNSYQSTTNISWDISWITLSPVLGKTPKDLGTYAGNRKMGPKEPFFSKKQTACQFVESRKVLSR